MFQYALLTALFTPRGPMRWQAVLPALAMLWLNPLAPEQVVAADSWAVFSAGEQPADRRLGPLRSLDGSAFPMVPVSSADAWPLRREAIRTRILVAAGLHPVPQRTPLRSEVFGKVTRPGYSVERVRFESFPGHYVTGSLYRPEQAASTKVPAVLCPHGHWPGGRFQDQGLETVRAEIAAGAEQFEVGGRYVIQARCVQLARMGCIAFAYDMEGYADSVQLEHRAGVRTSTATASDAEGHLLFSPRAELHGHTVLGLQTWNSLRAVDFVASLEEVDRTRIAVTGASGGATQTMLLAAIDERIAAAFAAVMVSTAMQGGCPCENAPYLRINQGNIDIAAAIAPRPLGVAAADDWTRDFEEQGHPDLAALYAMVGCPENYEAYFEIAFPHNFNAVNRLHMARFMNRHLRLGVPEPLAERDFVPLHPQQEAAVWTAQQPRPSGDAAGEAHERQLTAAWQAASRAAYDALPADSKEQVLTEALQVMVGRSPEEVGRVDWHVRHEQDRGTYVLQVGTFDGEQHGEQLPAIVAQPKQGWNRQTILWLTDRGKRGMFDDAGGLVAEAAARVEAGYALVAVDLFGQGEFVPAGQRDAITSVRLQGLEGRDEPWRQAACYTFGYNTPLPAERVRDVMTVVEALRSAEAEQRPEQVQLFATGVEAGPVGLIARRLLGERLAGATIDAEGFRFESIDRLDHPMLLPGILRYGGMDALR